jgi:hypothetical protein
MKKLDDVAAFLAERMQDLDLGKIDVKMLDAHANAAGKLYNTVKVQNEADTLLGRKPTSSFVQ